METKKSSKVDLENKRNMFLLLGLVVALGIILVAFEYKTSPMKTDMLGQLQIQDIEEEIIPVTREQQVKPPPPPPPQVVEVMNIVNNEEVIIDELEIENTEITGNMIFDVAPVVQTTKEEEEDGTQIFSIVEEMPEFPGGDRALLQFIANTIKYPVVAQENGIQGRVYVNFVVNVDGSVSEPRITRSVDPSLDKEALRVIGLLPTWKPGKQRGKAVRVSYNVPIYFQLQ